MAMRFKPWIGDQRDPDCPYDEDFTPEDEEEAYERYIDDLIDQKMEEK